MSDNTIAARVRARKDPAIREPPPVPHGKRSDTVRTLRLLANGREYPIGDNIDGDTPWELTVEGVATVTIPVRVTDDSLALLLATEGVLQDDGVRIVINGVYYVLATVSVDDTGLHTLGFEDEVAWRLRKYTRFLARSRRNTTRALFIQYMADEASAPPRMPIRTFIPELGDRQRIAAPTKGG